LKIKQLFQQTSRCHFFKQCKCRQLHSEIWFNCSKKLSLNLNILQFVFAKLLSIMAKVKTSTSFLQYFPHHTISQFHLLKIFSGYISDYKPLNLMQMRTKHNKVYFIRIQQTKERW